MRKLNKELLKIKKITNYRKIRKTTKLNTGLVFLYLKLQG